MFIEIGGYIVISALMAGVAIFASKAKGGSKTVARDVLKEYGIIKSAIIKYRKEKIGIIHDLAELSPYLEEGQKIDWKYYRLSGDEKFLVTDVEVPADAEAIVSSVGGDSYVMDSQVYLSFNTLVSKKEDNDFEPVASFKVFPERITTMTNVVYDTSESRAVDGIILEYRWEKALPIFDLFGMYNLKLRIKDKNGRWSLPFERKIEVFREEGLSMVAAGGTSLFVIHKDGTVDAQGNNDYGQLGMCSISPFNDREIVPLLYSVVQVEATDTHSLVLKVNGTVYGFGQNNFGQLGTGTKADVMIPKEVWGIKNIIQISAGENFSAALDSYGKVYTWGDNAHGQLGAERAGNREIPVIIDELSEIKHISLGYNHGLAVRQDGTVYVWGDNEVGQLGLGFKSKFSEVVMTGLKHIDKVIAGKNFSMAIDKKGLVYGWGTNGKYQLAQVGKKEVLFPTEINGLKDIVDIKTYGLYSIALDKYGKVFTWGQSSVLNEHFPDKPKLLDFLPLAKSIAIADRFAYLLTADDRVIRWSGDSKNIEEMRFRDMVVRIDDNV